MEKCKESKFDAISTFTEKSYYKSVALVIQGPLNEMIVKQVEVNARYFSTVVVSTWEARTNLEEKILEELEELGIIHGVLRIVVQKVPDISKSPLPGKLLMQVISIYGALEYISEEVVVKARSDEFMELRNFREFVDKSIYKYQFANFIVRDWRYHPFHISDHLFAAPRLNLLKSMAWLLIAKQDEITQILGSNSKCPESLLGVSLFKSDLNSIYYSKSPRQVFKMFTSKFELFDLENLDSFLVQANSAGTGYLSQISKIPIEIGDLINWNYFTDINQMKPSRIKSSFRRYIQPRLRQTFIKYRTKIKANRGSR